MAETIQQFLNRFLALHFPEVTYRLNTDGLVASGTQHNKDEILRVAVKLFQGNDQIHAHPPVDIADPSFRLVPFHDVNNKKGKIEIKGNIASKLFSGVVPEEAVVTFDEKTFSCRFIPGQAGTTEVGGKIQSGDVNSAICSATDRHKQVVVGGQWISYVPYALFFGAVCYSAHSIVEGVQLCRSIIKAVSSAPRQDPSGKPDVLKSAKVVLQIFRDRHKIHISKEETLGAAINRITKRVLKAGILSTAAVGIVFYDSRYVRV